MISSKKVSHYLVNMIQAIILILCIFCFFSQGRFIRKEGNSLILESDNFLYLGHDDRYITRWDLSNSKNSEITIKAGFEIETIISAGQSILVFGRSCITFGYFDSKEFNDVCKYPISDHVSEDRFVTSFEQGFIVIKSQKMEIFEIIDDAIRIQEVIPIQSSHVIDFELNRITGDLLILKASGKLTRIRLRSPRHQFEDITIPENLQSKAIGISVEPMTGIEYVYTDAGMVAPIDEKFEKINSNERQLDRSIENMNFFKIKAHYHIVGNMTEVRVWDVDKNHFEKIPINSRIKLDPYIGYSGIYLQSNSVDIIDFISFDMTKRDTYSLEYHGLKKRSSESIEGFISQYVVEEPSTIINAYAYIKNSVIQSGSINITLDSVEGFQDGDLAWVYQTQHGDPNQVGQYEFVNISSVDVLSNTVLLSSALKNSYYSGKPNRYGASVSQLVKVPRFDQLIISPGGSISSKPWDGKKGGVVIFDCNELYGNGSIIETSGKGFRGGDYGKSSGESGFEGEGIYGGGSPELFDGKVLGKRSVFINGEGFPSNNLNNGGSGSLGKVNSWSGGGGGGHMEAGGKGRSNTFAQANGGYVPPLHPAINRIFFGGGGGGGSSSTSSYGNNAWGGNGGGIIWARCNSINKVIFNAKGEDHATVSKNSGKSLGSGGAGGTVILETDDSSDVSISIAGGFGAKSSGSAYGGDGSRGVSFSFKRLPSQNNTCQEIFSIQGSNCNNCPASAVLISSSFSPAVCCGFEDFAVLLNNWTCEDHSFNCSIGYYEENSICKKCPRGKFNVFNGSVSCAICPDGAICTESDFYCTEGYQRDENNCRPFFYLQDTLPISSVVASLVYKEPYLYVGQIYNGIVSIYEYVNGRFDPRPRLLDLPDRINDMIIYEELIIVAKSTSDIVAFNRLSGLEDKVFNGHNGGVTCLEIQGSTLFSGSTNSDIIIWDIEIAEKILTLKSHTQEITDIIAYENRLVSSSKDKTVKMWDVLTGDLLSSYICEEVPYRITLKDYFFIITFNSESYFISCKILEDEFLCQPQVSIAPFSIRDLSKFQHLVVASDSSNDLILWNFTSSSGYLSMNGQAYFRDTLVTQNFLFGSDRDVVFWYEFPEKCPKGHEWNTSTCEKCPEGSFKLTESRTMCTKCPINAMCSHDSILCDAGYANFGDEFCKTCPENFNWTFSQNLANNICCSSLNGCLCPPGWESVDNQECQKCPSGKYKETYDNSTCKHCYNSRCEDGITFICSSGFEYVGNECSQCSMGKFKTHSGNHKCENCPLYAECQSDNFKCIKGYEWNGKQCSECTSSQFKVLAGNSLCSSCPTGAVCDGTNYQCSLGMELDSLNNCVSCAPSFYKPENGNQTCTECPENAQCSTIDFFCNAGYFRNGEKCEKCESGYYKPSGGNYNCLSCPHFSKCDSTSFVCESGYFGLDGIYVDEIDLNVRLDEDSLALPIWEVPETDRWKWINISKAFFVPEDGYVTIYIRVDDEAKVFLDGRLAFDESFIYGSPYSREYFLKNGTHVITMNSINKVHVGYVLISVKERKTGDVIVRSDRTWVLGDSISDASKGSCKSCPDDAFCSSSDFECEIGFERSEDNCSVCKVNTYKNFVGKEKCLDCPKNAVCSQLDFKCKKGFELVNNVCQRCDENSYKTISGNQSCTICPANAVCDYTSYQCNYYYELDYSSNNCIECQGDLKKLDVGNFSCFGAPEIHSVNSSQKSWESNSEITIFGINLNYSNIEIFITPLSNPNNDKKTTKLSADYDKILVRLPNLAPSEVYNIWAKVSSTPDIILPKYPKINSIFPYRALNTFGGETLTIDGENFDQDIEVYIDNELCQLNLLMSTKLEIITPKNIGMNMPVAIYRNGFRNQDLIDVSYLPPFIEDISPKRPGKTEETSLTIYGTNFGPFDNQIIVYFENSSVELTGVNTKWINSTAITTEIPTQVEDSDYLVHVQVSNQKSLVPSQIFRSVNFWIQNISPDNYQYPCAGSSFEAQIKVSNLTSVLKADRFAFTISSSTLSYSVRRSSIRPLNGTHLAAILPNFISPGVASLTVYVSGQPTENSVNVIYGPIVIRQLGDKKVWSTSGGENLKIYGKNFGFCEPKFCPYVEILIGDLKCNNSIHISDEVLQCITPPNIGQNLSVSLSINNISVKSPEKFFYEPPSISSVSPSQNSWISGEDILIEGTGFGSNYSDIDIYFEDSSGNNIKRCLEVSFTEENSVKCRLPQIVRNETRLSLLAGGQKSNTRLPQILEIIPQKGINTNGGENITIVGKNFDMMDKLIINDKVCEIMQRVLNESLIIFKMPPGVGKGNQLIGLHNGLHGFFEKHLDYMPPLLYSVSPKRRKSMNQTVVFLHGVHLGIEQDDSQVYFTELKNPSINFVSPNATILNSTTIKATLNPLMEAKVYIISVHVGNQKTEQRNVTFDNDDENLIPTAFNTDASVAQGASVLVQLSGTDENPEDQLSFYISQLPAKGEIYQYDEIQGGLIRSEDTMVSSPEAEVLYVHDKASPGNDEFKYVVKDSKGGVSENATVTIQVRGVNEPPEFTQTQLDYFIGSSADQLLEVPVTDFDEEEKVIIRAEKAPKRGNWYRQGSQESPKFDSMELKIGSRLFLGYQHDGKGGGYPFDEIIFVAKDSFKKESSNKLVVKIYVRCDVGFVNNVWSSGPLCLACPPGGICSDSGDKMPINAKGFFPVGNSTFISCSPPSACPEGISAKSVEVDFSCAEGYKGTRCGQCSSGYYRVAEFCEKCPSTELDLALVIPLALVILGILLFVMIMIRRIDIGFFGIMVTFLQTIAVFQKFKLDWPESVLNMFNVFSIFNLNIELASPECFMKNSSDYAYELKYFGTLSLPLILITFVSFVYSCRIFYTGIREKLRKSREKDPDAILSKMLEKLNSIQTGEKEKPMGHQDILRSASISCDGEPNRIRRLSASSFDFIKRGFSLRRQSGMAPKELDPAENPTMIATLTGACIYALKILYLSLARRALEVFSCTADGKGNFFFEPEPSRKCYVEEWWWRILPTSILSIFLFVIGIPLLTLYLSRKRIEILRKSILERSEREVFLLQVTYKRKREFQVKYDFWDVTIMIRKLLVVVSQLFFASYPGFQAVFLLWVLFIAYLLHREFQPYTIKSLNFLESTTIVASILVLMSGLLFFHGFIYERNLDILGYFVIIIVLIAALIVTGMLVYHLKSEIQRRKSVVSENRSSPRRVSFNETQEVIVSEYSNT